MTELRRAPDVVEAMKGAPRFTISFDQLGLARAFWTYGEDALVDTAVSASEADLVLVQNIAAVYYDRTYPLPLDGQKIQLGHVIAFAGIAYFEGRLRPLARPRRRSAKDMPARLVSAPPPPAVASLLGD